MTAPDALTTVLGIDGALTSGWAVLSVEASPRWIGSGVLRGTNDDKRRRNILDLFTTLDSPDYGVRLVALEGQFLDTSSLTAQRISQRAVWQLRRVLGWYEMACTLTHIPCETVQPDEWRAAVFGRAFVKGLPRERLKALAVQYVAAQYRIVASRHDEAEAVCIAYYAALRAWVRQQQQLAWRHRRGNYSESSGAGPGGRRRSESALPASP
jgi:Holliday junction resolvasome RuvABC endonuclease subunit